MKLSLRPVLGVLGMMLGVAVFGGAVACSGSDNVASADEDLTKMPQPTAKELEDLFNAVDDNCAGNDNGYLDTFDVKKFKAADALAKLHEEDRDAMGAHCIGQHALSSSRESGVKLFMDHINDPNEDTKSCLKEHLTAAQRTRLKQVVSDPTNVGVFSSVYSGGDNPEGCDYYNFHVYRRDGTFMQLMFNFTD